MEINNTLKKNKKSWRNFSAHPHSQHQCLPEHKDDMLACAFYVGKNFCWQPEQTAS